jgi:iron complex outermembrane receptor protein
VPARDHNSLVTAFLQDEISMLANRLALTLGSQVQYDSSTGAGVQPTARAIWKGLPHQRWWASTSRALRTPSLYERGIRVDFPPVPTAAGLPLAVVVLGNQTAETETVLDVEAGYRLELGTAEIGATAFNGRYGRLQTTEVAAPLIQFVPSPRIDVISQFGNQLEATTRGLEIDGRWSPGAAWRLDGSMTLFKVSPHLAAGSQDVTAAAGDASAPRTQWQLRTTMSPARRATVTAGLYYVGPLAQLAVDGYTRADINVDWKFGRQVSLMISGQNLLDAAHAEFATAGTLLLATQVPRAITLSLRWSSR